MYSINEVEDIFKDVTLLQRLQAHFSCAGFIKQQGPLFHQLGGIHAAGVCSDRAGCFCASVG